MEGGNSSETEGRRSDQNHWLEQRFVALVGQKINITVDRFFGVRGGRAVSATWILDRQVASTGPTLEMQFEKPGRHELTVTYDNRKVSRHIDVGVRLGDLLKDPSRFDFTYLIVGKNRDKAMFFPIAPSSSTKTLVNHRASVLAEMHRAEPAFRDFCNRQSGVWSQGILQRPVLPTKHLAEGVYAMFESGLVFLGFPTKLRASLESTKAALNHDADVSDVSLAQPGKVMTSINELVMSFDPRALGLDPNSILAPGSAGKLAVAGRWITRNIGALHSAFLDHLSLLGVDGAAARIGALFTFNLVNFTLSSRFSDAGLGISRQSTNMLGFGAGKGNSISLTGIVGDGSGFQFSNQGGRLGLMEGEESYIDESGEWVMVGRTQAGETWALQDSSGSTRIEVYDEGGAVIDGVPGGTGQSGETDDGTTDDSSTDDSSTDDSTTDDSTTDDSATDDSSGPTGSEPIGDYDTSNGDTAVANPGPEGTTGGGGNRAKLPIDEARKAMRGGGYTCPSPEYDGTGGGDFSVFTGRVGPIDEDPYDTLVNPGTVDVVGPHEMIEGGLLPPTDPAVDPVPDFGVIGWTTARVRAVESTRNPNRVFMFSGQLGGGEARGLFGFVASIPSKPRRVARSPVRSRTTRMSAVPPNGSVAEVLARLRRLERLVDKMRRTKR